VLRVLVILCVIFVMLALVRGALLALRGRRRRGRASAASDTKAAQDVARARAVLGVGAGASAAEIRAAYRDRAARAHPDAGGSAARMAELSAARDLLLSRAGPTSGK